MRNNTSELSEDYALIKELARTKREQKEPSRSQYILRELKEKGYDPQEDKENKCIHFLLHGNTITVWPYTGWFSGKGIKDGRGTKKLFRQI
jgi:hypothetical protein